MCRFRQDELSKYERYLSDILPRLIRDELKLRVQQKSLEIEEALLLQLINVVYKSQVQAFAGYQASYIDPLDNEKGLVEGAEASDLCPEMPTTEANPAEDDTATNLTVDTPAETPQYASLDIHDPSPFLNLPLFSSGHNGFPNSSFCPQLWPFDAVNEDSAC